MAGRPKGTPKTGGRKKGTPNKATAPIREAIAAKDPIGRLFELAQEARDAGDHELEHKVLATILPYGFPKLAAQQIDLNANLAPVSIEVTPYAGGTGEES